MPRVRPAATDPATPQGLIQFLQPSLLFRRGFAKAGDGVKAWPSSTTLRCHWPSPSQPFGCFFSPDPNDCLEKFALQACIPSWMSSGPGWCDNLGCDCRLIPPNSSHPDLPGSVSSFSERELCRDRGAKVGPLRDPLRQGWTGVGVFCQAGSTCAISTISPRSGSCCKDSR